MFVAKQYFEDLQDNSHPYYPGDIFPREGLTVTPERIKELATTANRRKMPLIAQSDEGIGIYTPEEEKPLTEPSTASEGHKRTSKRKK